MEVASQFAEWLKRQALFGAGLASLVVIAAPALGFAARSFETLLLLGLAVATALAAVALSALLLFDATLFASMSGKDEAAACAEVDLLLASMRLKPMPAATRPLSERIGGAKRLVRWQRAAMAVTAAAATAAMLRGLS